MVTRVAVVPCPPGEWTAERRDRSGRDRSDDEAESWRCRRERGDFLEECDDTGEERMLGEVGVERDAAGEDPDREERSVERSRKRAWGEERGEERDGIFF